MAEGEKWGIVVILFVIIVIFGLVLTQAAITGFSVNDLIKGSSDEGFFSKDKGAFTFSLILLVLSLILTIVTLILYNKWNG